MPYNSHQESKPRGHLYSQRLISISAKKQLDITNLCEVCGFSVAKPLYRLVDTGLTLIECRNCRLGSLHPMPTDEDIASFYSPGYYGSGGRKFTGLIENVVRLIGSRHAKFLAKQVNFQGRVLDVGCGRGVTLISLDKLGLEAHGFEVSVEAIEGLNTRIQTRVDKSLIDANYPAEFFDEVIIWHVLEHLPNPREIASEIQRILKPDGKLIVAVPNFSSWQSRWAKEAWFHLDAPRHLFHFPVAALKELLQGNNFEVLSEHHFSLRQNPFGWIQSALNKLPWCSQNGLYYLLHRRKLQSNDSIEFSKWTRFQLYILFLLLSPIALLMSVLAATFRQGATIHLVAKKKS